jgi:hypothetical protein
MYVCTKRLLPSRSTCNIQAVSLKQILEDELDVNCRPSLLTSHYKAYKLRHQCSFVNNVTESKLVIDRNTDEKTSFTHKELAPRLDSVTLLYIRTRSQACTAVRSP